MQSRWILFYLIPDRWSLNLFHGCLSVLSYIVAVLLILWLITTRVAILDDYQGSAAAAVNNSPVRFSRGIWQGQLASRSANHGRPKWRTPIVVFGKTTIGVRHFGRWQLGWWQSRPWLNHPRWVSLRHGALTSRWALWLLSNEAQIVLGKNLKDMYIVIISQIVITLYCQF